VVLSYYAAELSIAAFELSDERQEGFTRPHYT
jgi:hypothetical protein